MAEGQTNDAVVRSATNAVDGSSKSFANIRRLAGIADDSATDALARILRESESGPERLFVAEVLGERDSEEAKGALFDALGDESDAVRRQAAISLHRFSLSDPESERYALSAEDPSPGVRQAVATGLSAGSETSLDALLTLLDDSALKVRVAAFWSLCEQADPRLKIRLEAAAERESWLVRRALRRGVRGTYSAPTDS